MPNLTPVPTSLEDFARTGQLGPISLGASRAEVARAFGTPTDYHVNLNSGGNSLETSAIWKYGDIEFHFDDDRLWLFHCDVFDVPQGGGGMALYPWVVRRGMGLRELEAALRASGVGYVSAPYKPVLGSLQLTTSGGVRFVVEVERVDRGDELGLLLFCSVTRR